MEQKIILMHHGNTAHNFHFGGKLLTQKGYTEVVNTIKRLVEMQILSKTGSLTYLCSSFQPWCTSSAYACSQVLNKIDCFVSFMLSDNYNMGEILKLIEKKLIKYSTLIIITHINVLEEIQTNLIYKFWEDEPFNKEIIQTSVSVRVLFPNSKKLIISGPE